MLSMPNSINRSVRAARPLVFTCDGEPVGCGAFKKYDENSVEIKRMYVRPDARGMRIAAEVLTDLESWANELGFKEYILEPDSSSPRRSLFTNVQDYVIPNYGQYENVENSVCMKKSIG